MESDKTPSDSKADDATPAGGKRGATAKAATSSSSTPSESPVEAKAPEPPTRAEPLPAPEQAKAPEPLHAPEPHHAPAPVITPGTPGAPDYVEEEPVQALSADEAFAAAVDTAFGDFRAKLAAAWHPVDLCQAAAEAEVELQHSLSAFAAPWQELERCEARAAYLRTVRRLSSPERRHAQIAFAYERYLATVRPLWLRKDLGEIDPRVISHLGESIAWAGYYASLCRDG